MKDISRFKNSSLCNKHFSAANQRSNVCCHIKENLDNTEMYLDIIPLFIERVLLEKFYEKYWICESCAEAFSISKEGELWFDPNLRSFLEDDNGFDEDVGDFSIKIEAAMEALIVQVCRNCLLEKYGVKMKLTEAMVESLKERAVSS